MQGRAEPSFAQQQQHQRQDAQLAQREEAVDGIATSVVHLAEVVQDLAQMVIDQGTMLDRIDFNLENVRVSTEAAVRELTSADRHQRRGRMLNCILCLAMGIGCAALVLVLRLI